MELEKARAIAEELKDELEEWCEATEVVGEIRRKKQDIESIKLLCIPTEGIPLSPENLNLLGRYQKPIAEFEDYDDVDTRIEMLMVDRIVESHPENRWVPGARKKMLLHVPSGMSVCVLIADRRCWAVALVVATGGTKTVRCIAAAAREKGWRFQSSGDGFDTSDGHITCSTEQEVFEAVGLPYLPPEQRE